MHAHPLEGLRADVLRHVAERPGAMPAEIARAFGVDHSTAAYHLRRLQRARLVASEADGRYLRFYASGCRVCPFMREALPTLRDLWYASLLDALAGGRRVPDLATLPTEASRTRARLARLKELGLVANLYGTWAPTRDTEICRERARADGTCDLWGRCAVSRRYAEAASPSPIQAAPATSSTAFPSRSPPRPHEPSRGQRGPVYAGASRLPHRPQ